MNVYREQRSIVAAQLQADDLVLLDDGDRTVNWVANLPAYTQTDGKGRIRIQWMDGTESVWLADSTCEVVR